RDRGVPAGGGYRERPDERGDRRLDRGAGERYRVLLRGAQREVADPLVYGGVNQMTAIFSRRFIVNCGGRAYGRIKAFSTRCHYRNRRENAQREGSPKEGAAPGGVVRQDRRAAQAP